MDDIKWAASAVKGARDVKDAAKTAKGAKKLKDVTKCLTKNSFAPDTDVLTADGKSKPIKDLKTGDDVRTGDPATGGSSGAHKVTATMINHDENLVDLTITTADGHQDILHTTTEHPFWDDTTHTWAQAATLIPGHKLITDANKTVRLAAVHRLVSPAQDMYNLTVQGLHTYYVLAGTTPVLVHNTSPVGPGCGTGKAPRTPDGKFSKRNGEPGTDGSLDERTVLDQLELDGAPVIRGQVYARVPGFPLRKYDGAVQIDGRWLGVETKGGTSPLTPPQRAFDNWLNTPGNSVTTSGGITLEGTFNAWVPR